MSNFLINLAQRGAGLGPWTAINARPAHPEPVAGLSIHGSQDIGLTAGLDDHSLPPSDSAASLSSPVTSDNAHDISMTATDTPGIPPAQHLSTSESENLSARRDAVGETGMPVSNGDEAGPVSPFPEKKSPANAVKNVLPDPRPAAAGHSLQTSDIEHRVHSVEKVEDPAEKTVRFQHAPQRLEKSDRHSWGEDNRTSFSPQLPEQESKRPSVRPAQLRPATPVDMHSEVKKLARDNIRPPANRQGELSDQHVERIHDDLEASSFRNPEMQSSALNKKNMPQQKSHEEQLSAVDKKSYTHVKISAAKSQPVTAAMTASPLKTGVGGSDFKKPAAEPPVQVRIGQVELRAVQAQKKAPPQPAAASRSVGFDEFYSVRNYMYSEP